MTRFWDLRVIDAMTGEAFTGNPTPVFILDHLRKWPDKQVLQEIARELNQSDTIFVRRASKQNELGNLESQKGATGSVSTACVYDIKSFTPFKEEPFCGHGVVGATIALGDAGRVTGDVTFYTVDGIMVQAQLGAHSGEREQPGDSNIGHKWTVKLQIPSVPVTEDFNQDLGLRERIASTLNLHTRQIVSLGRNSLQDLVIELEDSVDFSATRMTIDAVALMEAFPPGTRSQVLTGNGSRYGVDFVKRVFAYGSEYQATGSTYCVLIPYWASRLGKSSLKVKQISERTGEVTVEAAAPGTDRAMLIASGVKIMEGKILVPRVGGDDGGEGVASRPKLECD
ncbi:hypothetical protein PV10_08692 [Exophiala mesophila]|uniref:Uncharacterized protein n=1 Tax=Exophiala mesophila TaxID=212818 RepID=A0A0D1XLN2_EXOME|nr:uncharacterized protein PV10_08692 [Exophiala mesophila]KIV89086.1 hypothetical protein PV10_08692 [Exophiala mesophila]